MKPWFAPAVTLVVLSLAFLGLLAWSSTQLPDEVAIHFGFQGHPDRWTGRSSAVAMMAGFGVGLPMLLVVFALLIRFLPGGAFNIPNREFWLAPEQRRVMDAFCLRQLLWLSCFIMCLMAGMHWLTVEANNSNPVRMPTGRLFGVLGVFLAALAVWIFNFIRWFRRVPPDAQRTPPQKGRR